MKPFTVSVPASTSNIGPGFDTVGLALDLRNDFTFSFDTPDRRVTIEGFENAKPVAFENNLIFRAFQSLFTRMDQPLPQGIAIHCVNRVPMGSGLGSSATAIVAGLNAANAYLNAGLSKNELLQLATPFDGHPDNVTPAIYGGLTASTMDGERVVMQSFPIADWQIALVVPHFDLPTGVARKALPRTVSLADAIFNLNHAIFLMRALQDGSETGLRLAMQDRLHQQYRIAMIPGSEKIIAAALDAGAAAAGLSGAGPGLISFTMNKERADTVLRAMAHAATDAEFQAEAIRAKISVDGATMIQ